MEDARRRQLEPGPPVQGLPRRPALAPSLEGPVPLPVHLRVDPVQGDGGLREGEVRVEPPQFRRQALALEPYGGMLVGPEPLFRRLQELLPTLRAG